MIDNPCYTEEYIVTSHNVDTNSNLKPTDLVQYMQETGNHHMRDRKPTYIDLLKEGKSFVVSRLTVEVIKSINNYETIKVHTWRAKEKGATFYRSFLVENNGEVVAKGFSEWAVPDRFKGGLCKASEINMESYELGPEINTILPTRFRFPKGIDWKQVDRYKVRYTSCDYNMHLNNSYYQDMMWNQIPEVENKRMVASSIRFKKEAMVGSEIDVYMVNQKDVEAPIINLEEDQKDYEVYYFITKIGEEKNSEGIVIATKADDKYKFEFKDRN